MVCGQNVTVALAVFPINGLVFHSLSLGGMNAERFTSFFAEVRIKLDPEDEIMFILCNDQMFSQLKAYFAHLNAQLYANDCLSMYAKFLNECMSC